MSETSNVIDRRYDFVFLFDVTNGNPNGDPDAGNAPRIDPETGRGFVSDVCLKRKIRDFVTLAKRDPVSGQPAAGYDIYVKHSGVLLEEHQRAFNAPEVKDSASDDRAALARKWMCQTYFDIRTFGAVLSVGQAKGLNCGQVRGPAQLVFAMSVDPICSLEQSITRVAITTPEKAEKQMESSGMTYSEMGRKELVPYALYVAHGFISPYLAADTGFSAADLDLLWQALSMMFEHDRSAARGEMSACRLVVFEHESMLGNAPAHRLFERVSIRRTDETRPARKFTDYEVTLDEADLPSGIKVLKLI